jgi:hypothetical protein
MVVKGSAIYEKIIHSLSVFAEAYLNFRKIGQVIA